MKTPDFNAKNCFSLIMLYPQTAKALNWIKDNVYLENWQDSDNIAVEPRFFKDIYSGITQAGLTIKAI